MDRVLRNIISGKRILILGFGREGKSTLREIMSLGDFLSITIADAKEITDALPEGIKTVTGERYLDCIDEYDVVFKSPGVVLKKPASEYNATVTAQMDVFLEAYKKQVIGITGTKGKSTTSSLIAHILGENGKKLLFAGNIGIPVFDIWKQVENDTIIVLEMSCHQLEYIKVSPGVSVLLNIYEDHLDHYGTRERYADAKKNIYRFQSGEDCLFTTSETINECEDVSSKVVLIDKNMAPFASLSDTGSRLKGEHNRLNAAFAYEVVRKLGIDKQQFLSAFASFAGLPHRLQFIGAKDGVDYYDDSISTTVKSAISAVESVENAGTIILGGMERNLDYDELIDYLVTSGLKRIVFMYASGLRMYNMYKEKLKDYDDAPESFYAENLDEAVKNAMAYAKEGSAVILSPAAASYDHFKNFEERGEIYKRLIF